MGVVRMLVTSGVVGAASSARAGAGLAELALRRTLPLMALGARATLATGSQAASAQALFRDELLTLYDDAAEIAGRQLRRARDELGARTTPPAGRTRTAELNGPPPRRHRVKV